MTDVLLFHHAQGLTAGVQSFADQLRAAGHRVIVPDLYEGAVFEVLTDGVNHAREVGFATIVERGRLAAEGLPEAMVYAGFSLGVMPAQLLAQTRPGAKGALLLHGCLPVTEFSPAWPDGVPVQIHAMDADDEFVGPDQDAAEELVAAVDGAELFLYPGAGHLFADPTLPAYDPDAAALLTRRVLDFL